MPSPDKKTPDYTSPEYLEAYKLGTKAADRRDEMPVSKSLNASAAYSDAYYDVLSRRLIGIAHASIFREVTRGKTMTNAMAS